MPPSSSTAEAKYKINFARSEMAVQEGFFALERLMGKLKAADARRTLLFGLHIKIVYIHD